MDYEKEEEIYSLISKMREEEEYFQYLEDVPEGVIEVLEDEMWTSYCNRHREPASWGHIVLWSLKEIYFFEGCGGFSDLKSIYKEQDGYEEAILYWGGLWQY